MAGYVTAGTTQKTAEMTSRLDCHLTEIAAVYALQDLFYVILTTLSVVVRRIVVGLDTRPHPGQKRAGLAGWITRASFAHPQADPEIGFLRRPRACRATTVSDELI